MDVTFLLFHCFPGEIGGFQREESQDIIRDVDWATRNVMLGYDVAGSTLKSLFYWVQGSYMFSRLWHNDQMAILLDWVAG